MLKKYWVDNDWKLFILIKAEHNGVYNIALILLNNFL